MNPTNAALPASTSSSCKVLLVQSFDLPVEEKKKKINWFY